MIKTGAEEIYDRYLRLQTYVGWTDDDARRVQRARPLLECYFQRLIDDFYDAIRREPETLAVLSGSPAQIDRLKASLIAWLRELFSGIYDQSYVERRWRVGWRHVEIGLQQVYTNAAISRLRAGLLGFLCSDWRDDEKDLVEVIQSLNKLLDLDLAIIEDTYYTENLKRQQNAERLAVLGQVAGGVAHEMRNPLNVVKTSVYYLRHANDPPPEKVLEHLARIERQVNAADGVITALADFAKLDLPVVQPLCLNACVAEAVEDSSLDASIRVTIRSLDDEVFVLGDRQQLLIVFGNLIRNARDAMPSGGQLSIVSSVGPGYVDTAITDSGCGIKPDVLPHIMEPMFTTKSRGIGLGLAITLAILEKHDGGLNVTSEVGHGSTFTVRLRAAKKDESLIES